MHGLHYKKIDKVGIEMSVQEGKDYLYLIWKDGNTRKQYIVGELTKNGQYEFRYGHEIDEAQALGFLPLISFPDLKKVYTNDILFPVFASRLPDRKRKDIDKILKKYGMEEYDAYQLLKRSGAQLPIDNLHFVDPILNIEGKFERNFYLAGVRHYLGCDGKNCNLSMDVSEGEEVYLRQEPDNKYDPYAIVVLSRTGKMVGYIPRYYSKAYSGILEEKRKVKCSILYVDKNQLCSECIKVNVKVF